jgi:hypothetical protein
MDRGYGKSLKKWKIIYCKLSLMNKIISFHQHVPLVTTNLSRSWNRWICSWRANEFIHTLNDVLFRKARHHDKPNISENKPQSGDPNTTVDSAENKVSVLIFWSPVAINYDWDIGYFRGGSRLHGDDGAYLHTKILLFRQLKKSMKERTSTQWSVQNSV